MRRNSINHFRTLPGTDNTLPAVKSGLICTKSKELSATMRITLTQISIARRLIITQSTKPLISTQQKDKMPLLENTGKFTGLHLSADRKTTRIDQALEENLSKIMS